VEYYFKLPEELVAQEPPEARGRERDDCRLVVLHRGTEKIEHRRFRDLSEYLDPLDVLVLNDARVVPTLLRGRDQEGRAVVLSVHSPTDDGNWHCLVAPAAVCRPQAEFALGPEGCITGRLLYEISVGSWRITLDAPKELVYRVAQPTYPGYLKQTPADPEYYQTVYNCRPGAVLLPAAGRHFTPAMLTELSGRGVAVVYVTLLTAVRSHHWVRKAFREDVAAGAIGDIAAEDRIQQSQPRGAIDYPRAERYEISAPSADAINDRRRRGGRVVVCGTSALRALETIADKTGLLWPQQGFTHLTIGPGHQFLACDSFVTNLHRPRSSELVLTAAFAGRDFLLRAYQEAIIPRGYFFYEFGDSMMVV
jgi:S-adenosylmethionine:tRNA ribosyltransferase-isomerase